MLSARDLASVARARLKDAKVLLSGKRYEGAVYLCGYAVEIALKARVVKTLKWSGFPETNKEFAGLLSFKSHDLDVLLSLSGWEPRIRTKLLAEWSVVNQWDPESRYERPGNVTEGQAVAMVGSAGKIVGVLL
jgi:HEPN domain-containing protein